MDKQTGIMSFSSPFVYKRASKNTFYSSVNSLINWDLIKKEIDQHYKESTNALGQRSYSGLLLFKMLLVGVWNGNLSDRKVEELVSDNLSAMVFCGLSLEDNVPDHSVLCRFRNKLVEAEAFDLLFEIINQQIEAKGLLVKTGVKVDASVIDSPRKPKGKKNYEIVEDREEVEQNQEDKSLQTNDLKIVAKTQPGVDTEARWLKKNGLRFGYKEHIVTDDNGLIIAVETTAANEHDSVKLESLIEKANLPTKAKIYADKAYRSAHISKIISDRKLKNRIHYKAVRGKKLTDRQKSFNKKVSSFRYTVERTFGSKVLWFKAGICRYVGLAKTNAQILMESIAYNLKRLPNMVVKNELTMG